jgi:hypothetical protein
MRVADRNETTNSAPGRTGTGWAFVETCSVGVLGGLSAVLPVVFLAAYLDPGGEVRLMIDALHEANVEAIVLPIWFACGVVTLVRMVRRARRSWQDSGEESPPVTRDSQQPTGGGSWPR